MKYYIIYNKHANKYMHRINGHEWTSNINEARLISTLNGAKQSVSSMISFPFYEEEKKQLYNKENIEIHAVEIEFKISKLVSKRENEKWVNHKE